MNDSGEWTISDYSSELFFCVVLLIPVWVRVSLVEGRCNDNGSSCRKRFSVKVDLFFPSEFAGTENPNLYTWTCWGRGESEQCSSGRRSRVGHVELKMTLT